MGKTLELEPPWPLFVTPQLETACQRGHYLQELWLLSLRNIRQLLKEWPNLSLQNKKTKDKDWRNVRRKSLIAESNVLYYM